MIFQLSLRRRCFLLSITPLRFSMILIRLPLRRRRCRFFDDGSFLSAGAGACRLRCRRHCRLRLDDVRGFESISRRRQILQDDADYVK